GRGGRPDGAASARGALCRRGHRVVGRRPAARRPRHAVRRGRRPAGLAPARGVGAGRGPGSRQVGRGPAAAGPAGGALRCAVGPGLGPRGGALGRPAAGRRRGGGVGTGRKRRRGPARGGAAASGARGTAGRGGGAGGGRDGHARRRGGAGGGAGILTLVSVVIPAFNEAGPLPATLAAVAALGPDEVIVVDDGSSDGTGAAAAKRGAAVVRLPFNMGKGAALTAGVRASRGEVLLFLDADLGASASEAAKLLHPVLAGRADMAVGAFPRGARPSGFGLVQGVARLAVRGLTGLEMASPLSGQRAVRRAVLERIGPLARGFGVDAALTVDAARAGFRVVEVPVDMRHRRTGRDAAGFLHRGRQLAHLFGALAPRLLRRAAAP